MKLRAGEDVAPWGIGYIEGSNVPELLGAGQSQPTLGLLPAPHFLGGDGWPEGGSWHPGFRNLRHVVLGPDRGGVPPSQKQGIRWYHNLDS